MTIQQEVKNLKQENILIWGGIIVLFIFFIIMFLLLGDLDPARYGDWECIEGKESFSIATESMETIKTYEDCEIATLVCNAGTGKCRQHYKCDCKKYAWVKKQ